jgi:hypothetical protein
MGEEEEVIQATNGRSVVLSNTTRASGVTTILILSPHFAGSLVNNTNIALSLSLIQQAVGPPPASAALAPSNKDMAFQQLLQ